MSSFAIPKKFALPLKFSSPITLKMHESSIFKYLSETAKAGMHPKQLTAGKFGVPSAHVGVLLISPVAQVVARPSTSTVQTLLKTGKCQLPTFGSYVSLFLIFTGSLWWLIK